MGRLTQGQRTQPSRHLATAVYDPRVQMTTQPNANVHDDAHSTCTETIGKTRVSLICLKSGTHPEPISNPLQGLNHYRKVIMVDSP